MINQKNDRYPGIRAFEQHESHLFFGRSRETKELYQLIKVNRLSVLFAKSGIGKSSLLNAGVIPLLADDVYKVFKVRFQDTQYTPAELVRMSLRAYAEQAYLLNAAEQKLAELRQLTGRNPTLWEEIKAYDFEKKLGFEPIFIFDQFEEFFLHGNEAQKEFIDCISDIVYERVPQNLQASIKSSSKTLGSSLFELFDDNDNDGNEEDNPLSWWQSPLDFKIVLSIRSDRLSLLDYLSVYMPTVLHNRYQLHPLGLAQVEEAIRMPARLKGNKYNTPPFEYEDKAVAEIYDALRSDDDKGEVESFQLQIVCEYIERQVEQRMPPQPIFVSTDYFMSEGSTLKGINKIINAYYERRIGELPQEEQKTARLIIEEGLIISGVRVSLPETALIDKYRITDRLLAQIVDTRIIRAEVTHLGKAYEIAHDTLVSPIVESRERRVAAERKEQERLAAEAERNRLAAEAEAQRLKAAEESRKRQRATVIATVAGIMSVVALLTLGWALWEQRVALEKKREATEKEALAKDNLNLFLKSDINRLLNEAQTLKNAGSIGAEKTKKKLHEADSLFNKIEVPSKSMSTEDKAALKIAIDAAKQ